MFNQFTLLTVLIFLAACGDTTPEVEPHWGDLFIIDNCMRCPDCCSASSSYEDNLVPNTLAQLEDGSVCEEDNVDKLSDEFTPHQLKIWCSMEADLYRLEPILCGPYFCPGGNCLCIIDNTGIYSIDHRLFEFK